MKYRSMPSLHMTTLGFLDAYIKFIIIKSPKISLGIVASGVCLLAILMGGRDEKFIDFDTGTIFVSRDIVSMNKVFHSLPTTKPK